MRSEIKNMKYRFMRYPEGKTKAVTFSYDDGCTTDMKFLSVLDKYGLRATLNLYSARFTENAQEGAIEEFREKALGAGHEIAVHGKWHKAPGLLSPVECIRDTLDCRLELESIFDTVIRGMAYPDSGIRIFSGQNNYETVRELLVSLGIVYARTLGEDNDSFLLPKDWYAWMPTVHNKNPKAMEWAESFVKIKVNECYCSRRYPRLFYMWGHTPEFENTNSWDMLEDMCRLFSEDEDIWAATNIEIYNYVRAYESLVISADGSRFYNPTLIDVWFNYDGKDYCVPSGEKLKIQL